MANNQVIRPDLKMDNDEVDVKQKSLYARLKKLFSTGTIVRNVGGKKLKIVDTGDLMYATDRNSSRDRFNRVRSTSYNAYTRDFSLSYQAARTDLFRDYDCVGPDTIVPLPDGTYPTIKELAEKYKDKPQERFYVFSYDHETDSIKLGKAYHPRKKGNRIGYKVTFDDGQYIVGSLKHPFMMRDGSYKMIYELRVGDSVMPFYQKDFYGHGYRHIYNFSKGWQSEHKIIAEQFGHPPEENEVVHHKNFDKTNNSPDNLQIMTDSDHRAYHCKIIADKLWSPENNPKTLEKMFNSDGYINRKFHHWNGERSGKNNPFFGKSNSEKSNEARSETLKEVFNNRNQTGEHNPKYRADITFANVKERAFEFYKENSKINLLDFIKHIHCDHSTLQSRLKNEDHNWKSFKQEIESTLNHKIVSIESIGEVDVYDITVEEYHNFSTDSCIVGNTMDMDPILSSALDIYVDESVTKNEMGETLTIKCDDDNVKGILNNLFYDILNIEHNLWSWTRNLVKYGDFYLRIYYSSQYGIYQVEPISSYNVERLENTDPLNKNYVKFQVRPTDTSQIETLEMFECAHFRLLSDSNFIPYGKCLSSNSYIETEYGVKRIDDIQIGDKVWSFNSNTQEIELTSVINKCNSGLKKIIKISCQHNQIECSEQHPILTYTDGILQYKNAENISLKDQLIINSNKNRKINSITLNTDFLTKHNHNGWKSNLLNLPKVPDPNFMKLLGFMFGDGWLNKKLNRVYFAIGVHEEINIEYSKLLEKYSGKTCKFIPSKENCGGQCYVDSRLLSEFLYINGFKGNARTKRVPLWVYELSDDNQIEFIKGLIDSDGSIFTDKWNVNRYSIELNNKELVEDIKSILNRLNIKCSNISERGFCGGTQICGVKCNRNKSYYIYFYLDAPKKEQLKKYKFTNSDFIITDPVRKIEICEEKETYDIQVESKNSNFIANGIIVHNSMLEGARRVWKQLSLLEDAMLIHRIMRAPERRIFKVDIGNIPPQDVDSFMEKMVSKMKKTPYVDPQTGEYNLKFNMMNMLDDYYLPVRGADSGTSIDTLSGMEFTGIDDIEYIRNKMMAALKIPKPFLGYDEMTGGKSTLSMEDVRFARTIQRIQKVVTTELRRIGISHLYSQGYHDEEIVNFDLELTNPSTIFEKEKIEIWSNKTSLARDIMELKLFSKKWIYKNVFNLSANDTTELLDEVVEDSKQAWRFKSIEEEGNDPAKPFEKINPNGENNGGGMGGPDLMSGGPSLGGPSLGNDPMGSEGLPPDLGGGSPLTETINNNEPTGSISEGHGEHADDWERPSQDGEKDANQYPFGEDVLGDKEINRKERQKTRSLTPQVRPISLSLEGVSYLKSLKRYFDVKDSKSVTTEKQELLIEVSDNKSMMDESNIIDDSSN